MTIDDRSAEQKISHRWAVVARDKFLSGWGLSSGGYSRCAWAVPNSAIHDGSIERMADEIRARGDMQYVSIVDLSTYRPPRGTAHFHIYVSRTS